MRKVLISLLLVGVALQAQAKDLEVVITNQSTAPATIHYSFSIQPNDEKPYNVEGELKNMKPYTEYFLNKVGVEEGALVNIHLDRVSVGNRTVIDAPCKVMLPTSREKIEIKVNLEQSNDNHGTLSCAWT